MRRALACLALGLVVLVGPSVALSLLVTGATLAGRAAAYAAEAGQTGEPSPTRRSAVTGPSAFARSDIPRRLLPIYRKTGGREVWRTRTGGRYPTWAVLAAVGKVESNHCKHMGPSSAGALGCMQFMPGTWPGYGHGDIYDPANSIPAARKYLRTYRARSDLGWALAAYNAGPGRADHPPRETRRYVRNALALARRYTQH